MKTPCRRTASLVCGVGLLFAGSCMYFPPAAPAAKPCDTSDFTGRRPFDSTLAASLPGYYRLTLVSDWEDEAGQAVSGTLVLQPTDTLHRFYERVFTGQWRRIGSRVAWGWSDIDLRGTSMASSAAPGGVDPDHPGVWVHSKGKLELGVWRGLDGSSTTLELKSVAREGFLGSWDSDVGADSYWNPLQLNFRR